jgi:NADPH-dependent 2,4-dienoyl-CoA reductase/sulfur reductase-like enzyme
MLFFYPKKVAFSQQKTQNVHKGGKKMDFVIVGGDAAGMSAASRAKRNRPELDVIVLEKTSDVSYSACGMPYNIADPDRSMDDLIVRKAKVFREKQGIDLRLGHRALAIDPSSKVVRGERDGERPFEVPYDKLLIATGASPIVPDFPGFDLPGVMALKSLEDGRKIKRFIQDLALRKVVIIGMGYIALEMCEALRARDIGVSMVKPGPIFLPWLQEELSATVKAEVEAHGVSVYLGRAIEKIVQGENGLHVIGPDLDLSCDMVLFAIGVTPNSEIAEEAGLELGPQGAISVDKRVRTTDPHVYAAGDCADAIHVVTGKKVWIPLALRANRAGWAVADDILGKPVSLQGVAGTAVFKVFGLQVARTGLNPHEAEKAGFTAVSVTIKARTRAHAHPGACMMGVQLVGDRDSGRLLGAQMVAEESAAHRINAPAVALHAGLTVEAFSQSDLAYAPPFGPVWDPALTAAIQLLKKM